MWLAIRTFFGNATVQDVLLAAFLFLVGALSNGSDDESTDDQ